MALLKFLKGNYSSLNNAAINEGQILICNDTAEMFVDVAADKRIKIGDFTVVENLAALEALDATTVPTSRLYYVEDGNILARSNGTTWIQVNKQPTIAELKTQLGLGSAAYTDASAYDVAGAADAVRTYVGDIPNGEDGNPVAASVIAYVNKKTDGIATSGNLEALGVRVTTAEGEIDALQEASAKHVEKVEGKSLILDVEIERLAGMSDGANKVEASENGKIKIDGVDTVVYTHPDKHTIADVDGLQNAIDDAKKAGTDAAGALDTYKDEMVTALAGKQDVIPENTYDVYGAASQALTDAKAYVDEEDVFHTDITTVNALGGISAGADLDGMTTHEILNTLLFPYVAFVLGSTSRSAAAATLENGATQTLSSASISITKKSKPITSVKLLNGSTVLGEKTGDDVAAGGTITFSNLGITVSKSNNPNLKFTVTDGTTSTDKNVGASTFVYPYYMGECAADATIDETLIEGLTKKVESKGNKTVTHSCENGRMVIAYPKAHGVLKSILDPNNFETIGDYTRSEVSVTGLDGTAQTYYVYASSAATVSSFKVQYKY